MDTAWPGTKVDESSWPGTRVEAGATPSMTPETDRALSETLAPTGNEMVGQNWIDWARRIAKAPSPSWMQPAERAIRQVATTPALPQIPVTDQSSGPVKLAASFWNPLTGFVTLENAALGAAYSVQPEIGAAMIAGTMAPQVKPWWQQIKRLPQMTPMEGLQLGMQTWPLVAAPFIHAPEPTFRPVEPTGPPTGGTAYVPPASRKIPGVVPEAAPVIPDLVPPPEKTSFTTYGREPIPGLQMAPEPPAPSGEARTVHDWKLQPDNRYAVAGENANASVELEPSGDVKLSNVKVFPGKRKQGFGTQFISSLMDDVNVMFPESQNVNLWSMPDNEGFWEKQGFEKTGQTQRVGSAQARQMARPTLREPVEPSGPTASSQELVDAAYTRLQEINAKETLSQTELDERQFLMQNADNPSAIAQRFGVTIKEGGEEDASRIRSTTQIPEREVRTQVGEETPLRQQGPPAGTRGEPVAEAAGVQQQPGSGVGDVVAPAPQEVSHAPGAGTGQVEQLPYWLKEEMGRRGLKTGRIFNDVDLQNPSIRAAITNDPTLSEAQKDSLLKTGSLPAAPVRPEPATFRVPAKTARDEFGFSEKTPVASYIIEQGGILSKTEAVKQGKFEDNPDLWGDRPTLSHPTHNKIYRATGEMPDLMAENLYREGLIPEPGTTAMYEALGRESKTTRKAASEQRQQAIETKTGDKQASEFGKAQAKEKAAGARPIYSDALHEGDKVIVDDQESTVTSVDPEGVVTLEDGKRFGMQEVTPNEVIYGELKISPERLAEESKSQEFKLAQPESVEEQAARTKRESGEKSTYEQLAEKQAQVKYGWVQKKTGTTGDLGQLDLEGVEASQEELFSQGQKLKLKANKEGGFVNSDILKEAVDFGKRLYSKGMDFAKWSGEMVRHLGEKIREHLDSIWKSVTGQNILPFARERGSFTLPSWKPMEVIPDDTAIGGVSVSGEGSAHGIAKVYIQDAIDKGILPENALEIGIGKTPEQMQRQGIAYINAGNDPAMIVQQMKRDGILSGQRMAALWAERNRLGAEREAAQLESFRSGTARAREKARASEQAEINFLREVRPLAGGISQQIMTAWQESKPGSLMTFDGLYRKALELNGHNEITDAQKVDLARRAKTGEAMKSKQDAAVQKLSKAVDKTFPNKKTPSTEEMKNIMRDFKNRLPCA